MPPCTSFPAATDELVVVHVVCDPRGLEGATALGTTAGGRTLALGTLDLLGPGPGAGSVRPPSELGVEVGTVVY